MQVWIILFSSARNESDYKFLTSAAGRIHIDLSDVLQFKNLEKHCLHFLNKNGFVIKIDIFVFFYDLWYSFMGVKVSGKKNR